MCNEYCKVFKGWCKSFTRIEAVLLALETVLIIVFIGLLVFVTLHLIYCSAELNAVIQDISETTTLSPSIGFPAVSTPLDAGEQVISTSTNTLPPDIECTWTPSVKTKATTHYYWSPGKKKAATQKVTLTTTTIQSKTSKLYNDDNDDLFKFYDNNPDGYNASQTYNKCVAALVKLKPPEDVTFGCILTKLTEYWTLTAASCIESIEEVESLDSFFIMDAYGMMNEGRSSSVVDVQIHPLYQGANRSYDLAALRSEDVLIASVEILLRVPTLLEYFVVAIGEKFTILGYGAYRSVDRSPEGRRLREVSTYTVSLARCAEEESDTWSPRHLGHGEALAEGTCGAGGSCGAHALCAGTLHTRTAPCAYCSGTPLVRAGKLYGIMARNRHCGVACEPTLYVNVAVLSDWVDSVISM